MANQEGIRKVSTRAFSVRTDSDKVRQLDRLAEQQDRSRNYLVNQAINQLLELYAWQDERVREGIQAADQGQFAGESEVERILNRYEDD